jgi:uncharacterized protein
MSTAAPVPATERIDAIDATRGLALLGIFFVNITLFALPFSSYMALEPPADASMLDAAAFYFTEVFCEGKFYVLFSALFGMGMVIMTGRARQRTGAFGWLYARRLLALMAIGFLHAMLLWYGDILFIYGVAGFALLILWRARGLTLIIIGGVIILNAAVFIAAFSAFQAGQLEKMQQQAAAIESSKEPATEAPETTTDTQPAPPPKTIGELFEGMGKGEVNGLMDPEWVRAETAAYSTGPYSALWTFRAVTWAFMIVFVLLGFGWTVIGMMLIGAGLVKCGLFEPGNERWHTRFALCGLLIGLPMAAFGAAAIHLFSLTVGLAVMSLMLTLSGPLVGLGYLGAMTLLVRSGRLRVLTHAMSCVGRMALTNYLMQSLIATTLFYYYGFGLFGQFSASERVGVVLAVYAAQLVISPFWMKRFQFGPVEWVWRSVTYMRPQPMRRVASSES